MSTVITKRDTIQCFPGIPCFAACFKELLVIPAGPNIAHFGPSVAGLALPNAGGVCNCTVFNITDAQYLNPQQLVGSSSPDGPFSQAVLTGIPLSDMIQADLTIKNGGGFCSLPNYYLTSGPTILGVGYGFKYWWAVVIAGCGFIVIVFGIMYYCGWCPKMCRRKVTKGTLLAPPAAAAAAAGSNSGGDIILEAQEYVYAPNQAMEMVPVATAAPNHPQTTDFRGLPVAAGPPTATTPIATTASTINTTSQEEATRPPPASEQPTYRPLTVQQEKAAVFTSPNTTTWFDSPIPTTSSASAAIGTTIGNASGQPTENGAANGGGAEQTNEGRSDASVQPSSDEDRILTLA